MGQKPRQFYLYSDFLKCGPISVVLSQLKFEFKNDLLRKLELNPPLPSNLLPQ